jgi:hypothetical protein
MIVPSAKLMTVATPTNAIGHGSTAERTSDTDAG